MERQAGVTIVYGPFSVHESNEYNINSITEYKFKGQRKVTRIGHNI